jgi:hypothetical protein
MTSAILARETLARETLAGAIVPARARRALIEAPMGPQPVVEAALAWRRLPPLTGEPAARGSFSGADQHGNLGGADQRENRGGADQRGNLGGADQRGNFLPIVETGDEDVATRVARSLSSLTFAVITRISDADHTRWQVSVPVLRHRPVTRMLALVWRQTVRQFGPDARMAGADRETAIALWRLATLLAEEDPIHHRLCFLPGAPVAGRLLVAAAGRLGVRADLRHVARRLAVVVEEPAQIRLLLTTVLAGASLISRPLPPGVPGTWRSGSPASVGG